MSRGGQGPSVQRGPLWPAQTALVEARDRKPLKMIISSTGGLCKRKQGTESSSLHEPIDFRAQACTCQMNAGFSSTERSWVVEKAKAMNAEYQGDLGLGCRFLVCRSILSATGGAKYIKALQWGVQVSAGEFRSVGCGAAGAWHA